MSNCCNFDMRSISDQLECKVKETEKGLQIDVSPKDASKVESLKALAKGCKDFCGCC